MLRSLHHHLLLLGFGLFPLPRRRRPLLPSSVASISSSPSAAAAASAAPPPQLGAFRMASGGSETSPDADAAAAAPAAAAEVAPPPVHKSKIRFCQACGSPTKQVVPQGEEKLRAVCTVCGKIHYENPKVVVGCLVVHDNKILLCKRKIEPSYGLWTLPAGYLEVGESAAEGATRETLEEACAEVEILSPFAQLDIPWIGQSFRAPMAMASKITAPKALTKEAEAEAAGANRLLQLPILRREALLISILPLNLSALALPSHARERRVRKTISPEEYSTSPDGLKYYDIIDGKGPTAEKGAVVQVHFDCMYRGITAVSSRESKLLAGNRSIAQPYEFTVGSPPGKERKRDFVDNANGLYSAQAAPKPPPAMYTITEGMKVGGKRTVIVPPERGYGKKGLNEIPPGAEFQLNIELLQVTPPGGR